MEKTATEATTEGAAVDADELVLRFEEESYARLVATGQLTAEKVALRREEKRHKEELWIRRYQIQNECWRGDPSCDMVEAYLAFAAALEGLHRREDAMSTLREGLGRVGELPRSGTAVLSLALAKLLFQADRKNESLDRCLLTVEACRHAKNGSLDEVAADAYFLGGWVHIHSDNHTAAYRLWSEGHAAIPTCARLARQHRKRACWDQRPPKTPGATNLVGGGAHGDGVFVEKDDLDAFAVPNGRMTPALALFDNERQGRKVVFRSRRALLLPSECADVVQIVEEFIREHRGGVWGTVRKASVPTTDVAVEDIPVLRPWLRELLHTRLYPLLAAAFPVLADGTSLIDAVTGESRMRVHDAFIVRYAADDESLLLPEHSDTSAISFTVALNSGCFQGGGTWFEDCGESNDGTGLVVRAEMGQAVAFAGPLRHSGYPITSGTRLILVLFLYVEDFAYGNLIEQFCCLASSEVSEPAIDGPSGVHFQSKGGTVECPPLSQFERLENVRSAGRAPSSQSVGAKACVSPHLQVRPSGDSPGGFVVYRQTAELTSMLQKKSTRTSNST